MLNLYYQIAIDSMGQPFLDAEAQMIAQGQSALPFLQERLHLATGMQRLVTQVIMERIAGNGDFKASLQYLEQAEQRAAATVLRAPPPEGVAEYLFRHFGDGVASLLGVYVVKLGHIWPGWKTLGVILYLGKLNSAASADVLIRFMSTTTSEHCRKIAVQSLVAVGDASVLAKLDAELKPIDAARQALQQAADQIRNKLKLT